MIVFPHIQQRPIGSDQYTRHALEIGGQIKELRHHLRLLFLITSKPCRLEHENGCPDAFCIAGRDRRTTGEGTCSSARRMLHHLFVRLRPPFLPRTITESKQLSAQKWCLLSATSHNYLSRIRGTCHHASSYHSFLFEGYSSKYSPTIQTTDT